MITVRITAHELATFATEKGKHEPNRKANPRETEQYVLNRLQNAGIPVVGATFLISLDRGRLSIERQFGDYIYTWGNT